MNISWIGSNENILISLYSFDNLKPNKPMFAPTSTQTEFWVSVWLKIQSFSVSSTPFSQIPLTEMSAVALSNAKTARLGYFF